MSSDQKHGRSTGDARAGEALNGERSPAVLADASERGGAGKGEELNGISPAVLADGPEMELKLREIEDAIRAGDAALRKAGEIPKAGETPKAGAIPKAGEIPRAEIPEAKRTAEILSGLDILHAPVGLRGPMRRLTSKELPREITEYMELVERDEPRACQEQHALVELVRRRFDEEWIFVDLPRLEKYMGLQKYFPFDLFPWQKFLIALWLCSFRPNGAPRWRINFAMIARGAGKDGLIAYVALCLVSPYNPVRRYDVDICANDKDQAVRPVADLVDVLETPGQEAKLDRSFYHTKEMVRGLKNRGRIRGWTNNPKNRDGMRSGLIVFNEVHQYQNYANINVFTSGLGKVKDPRIGIFSSNGHVNDGPLDDYLARGRRILFEGEDDEGFLPFICCLANRQQVDDPENWSMANPSWAYLPELRQETADEYRAWKEAPEQNGDFLAKRMGLRAGFTEASVTDYQKVRATNKALPELKGRPCTVGIDYAEMSDWAGVILHFREGDKRYDIGHAWICEESKTLHRVRAPWKAWVETGKCTLVNEPTIPPRLLAEWIRQNGTVFRIRKLAMDHFRWTLFSDVLTEIGFDARDKEKVKLVRPSDIMRVEPVIQHCFDNELFFWGDNPVLRWGVSNTKRVPASRNIGSDTGNYYYAKIEPKSRKNDLFMALVAAMTIEDAIPRGGTLRPPPAAVVW